MGKTQLRDKILLSNLYDYLILGSKLDNNLINYITIKIYNANKLLSLRGLYGNDIPST
jgi:hypothetical protein